MASNVVEYEVPNQSELVRDGDSLMEVAKSFEVTTNATYALAAEEVRDIKARIKMLDEKRKSITSKFDEAKKAVMDLFKPGIEKLEEAKSYYERGMIGYSREQERIQAEAHAKAEAAARVEREQLEEVARKKAAQAGKVKNEETAARLREEAEAAKAAAECVTATAITNVMPVAAGTSMRKPWKGRCENKLELLAFIVSNPAFVDLVDVNQSVLNKIASAQKENMAIGGCKSYQESTVVSRK